MGAPHLTADTICADLKVTSKKQALQEIAAVFAKVHGLAEREVFDTLLERERLGSTGVGRGIAIPHGKLQDLDEVVGVFARLERPVDFDAHDDQPVDLIFAMLAPMGAGADHLKSLAKVSRLLKEQALCEKLRGAEGSDAIEALLSQHADSRAA
ncbi:MAG: PTS IIA-like nitrogen regulatory protein PtsN [Alphaproteobacteria bacterium]|nr:PTS IIA-like nitrogen regulatory protein PtsN [Alphaproteobacteria bacterium SS10]